MFFRLSHIDNAPLPCPVSIDRTSYVAVRGGLLLEPPQPNEDNGYETIGYSWLNIFGMRAPDDAPDFLASSSEAYRWVSDRELLISRSVPDGGARFACTIDGALLELRAVSETRFLARGTSLRFSAAPDEPISEDWSSTLDFGPPMMVPSEPSRRNDPVVLAAIQEYILAGEPERRRAVRARLEHAWRAPA